MPHPSRPESKRALGTRLGPSVFLVTALVQGEVGRTRAVALGVHAVADERDPPIARNGPRERVLVVGPRAVERCRGQLDRLARQLSVAPCEPARCGVPGGLQCQARARAQVAVDQPGERGRLGLGQNVVGTVLPGLEDGGVGTQPLLELVLDETLLGRLCPVLVAVPAVAAVVDDPEADAAGVGEIL